MEFAMNDRLRLAEVWCTHADRDDGAAQRRLREFIADCRKRGIFVCVYESGDGDLSENTGALLAYACAHPPVCPAPPDGAAPQGQGDPDKRRTT